MKHFVEGRCIEGKCIIMLQISQRGAREGIRTPEGECVGNITNATLGERALHREKLYYRCVDLPTGCDGRDSNPRVSIRLIVRAIRIEHCIYRLFPMFRIKVKEERLFH